MLEISLTRQIHTSYIRNEHYINPWWLKFSKCHVSHLMVSAEQREDTSPVVEVVVDPEVSRCICVCQHPFFSWHSHLTAGVWSKILQKSKNAVCLFSQITCACLFSSPDVIHRIGLGITCLLKEPVLLLFHRWLLPFYWDKPCITAHKNTECNVRLSFGLLFKRMNIIPANVLGSLTFFLLK